MTNLVLGKGLQVIYQAGATASTFVPESLSESIRQQNRWNKSFYREMLWTMRIAERVHLYALVDMLLQPLLFVSYTLALAHALLLLLATGDLRVAGFYLAALATTASLRALYGLLCTRDWGFPAVCSVWLSPRLRADPGTFQVTPDADGQSLGHTGSPRDQLVPRFRRLSGRLLWSAGSDGRVDDSAASAMAVIPTPTDWFSFTGALETRLAHLAITASSWLAAFAIVLASVIGAARFWGKRQTARRAPTVFAADAAQTEKQPTTALKLTNVERGGLEI